MSKPVLEVAGLGKCFFSYLRERYRFMAWMGLHRRAPAEHWALRDVSFRLEPGETVGVIGENAAGKSTLLKLITGTLRPTRGHIRVNGRISAILELGMGFNPEFTGRRNARHAAALLGLSRRELDGALPEICAFSELDAYFDQPVRTYSSGMQMRLAFAVATAARPDILIVDEALSVGDAYFQHKCMQRIRSFRDAGTALLFVSHAQDAVRMLCTRGLLLQAGELIMDADTASVIDYYRAAMVKKCEMNAPGESGSQIKGMARDRPGRRSKTVLSRDAVQSLDVELIHPGAHILSGDDVTIRIRASFSKNYPDPHVGIGLRNRLGVVIYEANTYTLGCASRPVRADEVLVATFTFRCDLYPDTYELMLGVADTAYGRDAFQRSLFFDQSYLVFEVLAGPETGWSGLCNIRARASMV